MSIKAKLNQADIFVFQYDDTTWPALKKEKGLTMPCCGQPAIPRISNGYPFFAHAKDCSCPTGDDSIEQITLKNLIANAAIFNGWQVATEQVGQEWSADVFCTKGNAKLAFEIHCQPYTDFVRQQSIYAQQGIRPAWFCKSAIEALPSNKETPAFSFKSVKKQLIITEFNIPVEQFIAGMFKGELKWDVDGWRFNGNKAET